MILRPVQSSGKKSRKGKGAQKSHSKNTRRQSFANKARRKEWYRVHVLGAAVVTTSGPTKFQPVPTVDVVPVGEVSTANSSRLLMYGAAATGALYAILKR